MPSVFITGANRGLGLEFCRQYAHEGGWRIFACCRQPEQAHNLQTIAQNYPQLSIHQLEVSDFNRVEQLAKELAAEPIDILLNNAGIYNQEEEQSATLNYEAWLETLRINTLAPVKIAEAFLPNVLKSQRKLIVAMTSLMGSIADNTSGGSILYRSSKAALNAAMKCRAIDLQAQGVAVLILHPGWVKTDMGGSHAPTEIFDSVAQMRQVIEKFTLKETGSFVNFRGQRLPW